MHAVLQNDELLATICNFVLGPREWLWEIRGAAPAVVSLALVCRDFSWIALSVLWRVIDINALCFTFPEDIVSMGEDGKKSWNLTPITPEQWSRFDIYARSIRHITLTASDNDSGIDGLFNALGHYPHLQNQFPRLERLTLQNIEASRFRDAAILLCPTLTDVAITLRLMNDKGHRDVADFLQALGGRSTSLQKFSYHDDSEEMKTRPDYFFDSLTHLIRNSKRLRTVKIPLSHHTLDALAQLPSLTQLALDHFMSLLAEWTPPEIGITENKRPDEQDTFVSLESLILTLDRPWPSNFFKGLLRGLWCAPKAFEMRIYHSTPTELEATELARFLEDMFSQRRNAQPLRSVGLERFSLEYYDNDDLGCTVTWRSFNCLLSLPNLQHVYFHGLFFDITDLDLEEITKMWRNLRLLVFTAESDQPVGGSQSQVTFAGLVHLSNLPELRHLSLMLNAGAEISSTMLSTKSLFTSALVTLTITGEFPKVTIIDATLFFAKHFPNLKGIVAVGSEKSRKKWGRVQAGLYSAQQALVSVRNA